MENLSGRWIESTGTRIIASNQTGEVLVNNSELKWNTHQEQEILRLGDISKQLKALGYSPVYYVWYELGIYGYIYQFGNYDQEAWIEHGKTRGCA